MTPEAIIGLLRGYRFPLSPEKATQPRRPLLVADLFCGAGGTSKGAKRALARQQLAMTLVAVNHWEPAIETHRRNHPEVRHYCMDLEAAKPEALVPEGYLDLLMASPTCTYHSRARGGKPTSDQQRMDPWHVVRWCTTLRVRRLLIENVPEFVDWGPVDKRAGRPIKSRRGEYFRARIAALEAIGFCLEWRILNCADYGDATTRKRFFLMGRTDGRPIRWPEPTHAPADRAALLGLKPWRPAREIIDWTRRGRSIFGRRKDLAPNTLRRIAAGFRKQAARWRAPSWWCCATTATPCPSRSRCRRSPRKAPTSPSPSPSWSRKAPTAPRATSGSRCRRSLRTASRCWCSRISNPSCSDSSPVRPRGPSRSRCRPSAPAAPSPSSSRMSNRSSST